MANVIRLKRASGSDPAASDLVSGEPAVRTDTGELFFKKDDGSIAKVAGAGGGPDFKYLALRNAANNGAASFPNADFTLVTSGTTSAITPTAANTLLVSVNGVIQKPNTGTSTPSQGFALSGSTIKFGANISAAPDFILYQESGGIGEPSDDTVSEVKLKVSNSPVNGYFLSAQSGNNGGLTWAAPVATSCTGNSATATALATARTINGTSFDGTANITVTAAAGTLTGNTLNSSVTASSLTSLGDLSGLTVTGDVVIADSIIHSGDTNTKIRFPAADTFSVETAGSERLNLTASQFRVKVPNSAGDYISHWNNTSLGLKFFDASGSSKYIGLAAEDSGTSINHATFKIFRQGSSVNRAYIDSSGNFGIQSGKLRIPDTIEHNDDPNTKIRFPANDTVTIETAGSERFRIDSSGRLLLGTTTEGIVNADDLTVASSGHTGVTIRSGTSSQGNIFFADGTSGTDEYKGYFQYLHAIDALLIGTDATERMRIDSSGRLLLGTTTEGHNNSDDLTIANTGHAGISVRSGTSNNGSIFFSDGTSGADEYRGWVQYTHTSDYLTFGTNAGERLRIDTSGRLLLGTTTEGHASADDLTIAGSGQTGITIRSGTSNDAAIFFADGTSGDAEYRGFVQYNHTNDQLNFGTAGSTRATIKSDGKVGIGTTSPDAILEVTNGGTEPRLVRIHNSSSNGSAIQFTNTDTGNSTNQGYFVGLGASGDANVWHQSNFNLLFATNNTERMRIKSDGDVLLTRATAGGGGNETLLISANYGSGSDQAIQASNNLRFYTNGANERIRIDTSGNVGIKTSSPIGTLDVHDGSFVLSKPNSSGNERNWRFLNNNVAAGNLGLQVSTAAGGSTFSNVIEITKTGQVGIGTGSPVNKLHVNSGSTNTAALFESTDTEVAIQLKDTTGSSVIKARNDFRFDNSTGELMRIDSSGNVHIGKTASDFAIEGFSFRNLGSGAFVLQGTRDGSGGAVIECNRHTNVGRQIEFYRGSSNLVGHIESNNTSTAYNTSGSDKTLKKNFESWNENVLDLFKSINPQKFNFIQEDDEAEKSKGFVAQDMVSSFPEAYTKGEEEDSKYFFNPSGMVVYLMKAIQDLNAKVEALEAK